MSYGANFPARFKRAPGLVDRILKEANPALIPIEQVNGCDLVVNLRTARALGLQIPRAMLLRATRVIE
jgi:putative ABC transport system substrate-binding protein